MQIRMLDPPREAVEQAPLELGVDICEVKLEVVCKHMDQPTQIWLGECTTDCQAKPLEVAGAEGPSGGEKAGRPPEC